MPWRRDALRDAVSEIEGRIRERAPAAELLALLDGSKRTLREYFRRRLKDPSAATALTLKVLNVLLAKYHFRERSTFVLSRPFGLLVDPCNGCNLACPGCVQSTRAKSLRLFEWNNGMLAVDRFAELLARYGAYAMQIMFCNWGEPTINPNTPRLIEMAREYLIQTALSTNLSLARFDADAYVRSGLDFMYLAIDGASQAVYARYRRNGDIATVYHNVENLVAAKRRLGRRAPILRWQYLAFEHNAHEIPQALEMSKALGVDQFVVEIPFDVSWDDPNIHPADVRPFHVELTTDTEEMLEQNWEGHVANGAAGVVECAFDRGWRSDASRPHAHESHAASAHTCSWLYKSMTMDANGGILPCCAAPKPGMDLVFGALADDRADCFNSERYQQARRSFGDRRAYEAAQSAGGPAPYCANCEWNQERTEFSPAAVAQYLRTVCHGVLDTSTIEICSNW